MSGIERFANDEFDIELIPDGDSFIVRAPGLAKGLGFRDAHAMVRTIPDDEKGYTNSRTPGGDQEIWHVTEPGMYRAIGQRQTTRVKNPELRARAERFQRWIFHEVLPALRRTGSYSIPGAQPVAELTIPQTLPAALRAYAAELDRNEALSAELAEVEATNRKLSPKAARADQYEANPGITPTVFHKTYFAGVTERHFFEHLYRKDYLIDQRNARWDEKKQEWKPGPEHMHPTAKGKRYFYLQPKLDRGGVRRQQTLVIPGDAEHDLVAALERDGLPSLNRPAIPGADVLHLPRQMRGDAS